MPKLIVQQGYRAINDFTLPDGTTSIGRNSDNTLVLDSRSVSRHHANIHFRDNQYFFEDLGSHNGTFLNSRPVGEQSPLKHMDVLQLGDIVLVFQSSDMDNSIFEDGESKPFTFEYLQEITTLLTANIRRVVKGKDGVIHNILIALFSDGHVLLEDVPGVGKTVLAHALAKSIHADFKRIQFTPDMLPTDITGITIYEEASGEFRFVPGPIFANIVLADEINRGTPRTQSSLLECMAESAVTVDGNRHVLKKPFFVIATQNPIDFHGTYALPEAQLDRFLMRLEMGYPDKEVERDILSSRTDSNPLDEITSVVRTNDILRCQALVRTVHVSDQVKDYICAIAEHTRKHPAFVYGCSPRASLALMRVAQSYAALQGRDYTVPEDARDMSAQTLSHRLVLKLQAKSEWENSAQVVRQILDEIPIEKFEH